MRSLELLLSIMAIIIALAFFLPKFPTLWKERIFPIILGLAALAQISLEGFRWQLWPLFLAVLGLILLALIGSEGKGRKIMAGATGLLVLLSIAGAVIFPVPDPYPMTGPYQVGTRVVHLIDPNRNEIYGEVANTAREFTAQIWYPAEPGAADQRALWMPAIEYAAPAIAEKLNLPAFTLGHLKYVLANAYLEARPVQDGNAFPVLIFSHGWEGFKEQNIYQVEELASHGYVVIGLSHTYGAVLTSFPDGRQMLTDQKALPDGVSEEAYDKASNRLVQQWAGDISWTLDELERMDQESGLSFLSGMIDLEKIGLLGHSTGGGAAVEFCLTDERCQAILGMDIWAEPALPEILALRLTQPTLSMLSESWYYPNEPDRNYEVLGTLVERAESEVAEIALRGTRHYDFTSLPLLTPLAAQLGLKGPIPGTLGLEIINAESVAFFDQYLKGAQGINLEEIASRYPEAVWIIRP
jgi:hypothetical protein